MGTTQCPKCKEFVADRAEFCSHCGTAIPSPEVVAPTDSPSPPRPGTPPPRRISKLFLVILVLAAIVFVSALGAVLVISSEKPPAILVSEVLLQSPDNACGLESRDVSFAGFNASTRQAQPFVFGIPNYNSTACTIRGATTNTSGFLVSNAEVPLTVPPGPSGKSLVLTITSPGSAYSGVLNLILT